MARKIVVTSGKGGVGKTTVACKLSAALARRGQRVLLFDGDFGLNNVDTATGVEDFVTYDIVDVIEGRCRAKQALVKHPDFPNLAVLTSTHSAPERYISPQALKLVLDHLAPQFDFLFIDCPAGIDEGFHRAVACADEAIVVTTPNLSAVRDADKVITLLKSYELNEVKLIVNKVRGEQLAVGQGLSPIQIADLLKTPILGVLPQENEIENGDFCGLHPAVRLLARNILSKDKIKLYDTTRKYTGVVGALRRVLKRSI